jgi:hypothetical protein
LDVLDERLRAAAHSVYDQLCSEAAHIVINHSCMEGETPVREVWPPFDGIAD